MEVKTCSFLTIRLAAVTTKLSACAATPTVNAKSPTTTAAVAATKKYSVPCAIAVIAGAATTA